MPLYAANDYIYSNMIKQTNEITALEWCFFFVRLLIGINDLDQKNIYKAYNISFSPSYMVEQGIYRMKLNRAQAKFLITSRIATLHPIFPTSEIVSEPRSYIIKTMPGFIIPEDIKFANLSNNYYILDSISNKSILNSSKIIAYEQLGSIKMFNRFTYEYTTAGIEDLQPPIDSYFPKGNRYSEKKYAFPRALNSIGLDGFKQVVVLTDTGIDPYHPMFHDKEISVPINETNTNHRKIVRFDALTNKTDDMNGHGTHIAGTIAGSLGEQNHKLLEYEGMAPSAKLYIVGIEGADGNVTFANYSIPNIMERAYDINGLIFANAWGTYDNNTLLTEAYDEMCYENPDFLTIFPVGNDPKFQKIASPADGKNVLSVGAIQSTKGSAVHENEKRVYYAKTNSAIFEVKHYNWSKNPYDAKFDSYYQMVDNIPLFNKKIRTIYDNKIMLILKENISCNSLDNRMLGYFIPEDANLVCNRTNSIVMGYNNSYKDILGNTNYVSILVDSKESPKHEESSFSVFGPTKTGIFKPDIVAPGENVYSARAGDPNVKERRELNWSSMISRTGTSSAAAAVAGLSAVIRQYFEDGWYPTRKKNNGNSLVPSSSLIKAMLIASAKPPDGSRLEGGPTKEYGYGVPIIKDILGIDVIKEEEVDDSVGIRVFDQIQIGSNDQHVFNIKVQYPNQTLIVAMSYLDVTIDSASRKPLVVDISTVLIAPNKTKIYYGNQNEFGEDNFATNERIVVHNAPVGEYTLLVKSSMFNLQNKTIDYSIVYKGGFSNSDIKSNPIEDQPFYSSKCFFGCNESCENDNCECEPNRVGFQCEHELKDPIGNNNLSFHPKEVKYFKTSSDYKLLFEMQSPSPNVTVHYCFSKKKFSKIADFDLTCNYTSSSIFNVIKQRKNTYFAMWAVAQKPVNVSFSFKEIVSPLFPKRTQVPIFVPPEGVNYYIDYTAITTTLLMITIVVMRCIRSSRKEQLKEYSSKQSKIAAEEGKILGYDDKTFLANVLYDTNNM